MKNEGKSDKNEPSNVTQDNHIIFSYEEQKMELLGQIFGSKTSRDIITNLIEEKDMTALEISKKLNLKLNLVLYHLNKMLELQIISVSKLTKSSRGHQVKHYRAKQAVMIFSKNTKDKASKSKTLSNAIMRVTKFSAIGFAGVFTWFTANLNIQQTKILESADMALKYPRPAMPSYMIPIEPQSAILVPEFLTPIIAGSATVASLLIIDKLITRRQLTRSKHKMLEELMNSES